MTIPKSAGLSRLADVADESIGVHSYPVKKKGQPRRLDPNWGAINWLESETETDTEISEEYDAGESVFDGEGNFLGTDFLIQRALGYFSARQAGMYPWPMFQTFATFKASMSPYPDPCPDCDDWSRTSRCEVHHDQDGVAGLKMGDERRRARQRERDRAAGRRVVAYAPAERPSMVDYFRQVVDNSEARYTSMADYFRTFTWAEQEDERDRQMREQARLYAQTPCTCSMCQPRATDPNEGRPGYHYSLANDRWERDTPDALGDFRAGGRGFQMPDLLNLDRVPGDLISAEALNRLRNLPDGSITINNATIEVNGETVQGIQSFRINIEGDARE